MVTQKDVLDIWGTSFWKIPETTEGEKERESRRRGEREKETRGAEWREMKWNALKRERLLIWNISLLEQSNTQFSFWLQNLLSTQMFKHWVCLLHSGGTAW